MSLKRWRFIEEEPDEPGLVEDEAGPWLTFADHEAEVSALRALVARQAEALRRLSNAGRFQIGDEFLAVCPECEGQENAHDSTCWLAPLLADPSTVSALSWHEEEKRRAVREALEAVQAVDQTIVDHAGARFMLHKKIAELLSPAT